MDRSFPTVRRMTDAERLSEGRRLPVGSEIHTSTPSVDVYMAKNRIQRKKRPARARATSPDARAIAERRWCNDVPADVRDEIDRLASLAARHASGPETTTTMDAIVNEWLEPYGIAQKSTWDAETRQLTVEMTTLEALHATP